MLVEEVTPQVENFGVYIDNYHCDVNDKVSCPRTLIVRHETQEVLMQTTQMMPLKVQVRGVGPARVHSGRAGRALSEVPTAEDGSEGPT